MKVYRIRNKETGEFWIGSHNRNKTYTKKSYAKNSWNKFHEHPWNKNSDYFCVSFDQQDDYEIIEYVLVNVEEYDRLKDIEESNSTCKELSKYTYQNIEPYDKEL